MCGPETSTNCETVIVSQYGSILGVPLLVFGLAGFVLVLVLLLFPKSRGAILLTPLAVMAATAGLVLLALQFYVIGHLCIVCVAADVAALGLGGLVLPARLLPRRGVYLFVTIGFFSLFAGPCPHVDLGLDWGRPVVLAFGLL